jgi:CheY-like chemotaxis protein
MDNFMKTMNGPEACKHIRELGYNGIVIGLSGNVLDDDVADYLQHGANHFMSKPIDMIKLTSHLRNVYYMVTNNNV